MESISTPRIQSQQGDCPCAKAINHTDQTSLNPSINQSTLVEGSDKYHLRDFEPPVNDGEMLGKQQELLCWHYCMGHSRRETANATGLSPYTVRNVMNTVYRKCGVSTQVALMAKYQAAEREAWWWSLQDAKESVGLRVLGGVA